jgi:hypothetical protein
MPLYIIKMHNVLVAVIIVLLFLLFVKMVRRPCAEGLENNASASKTDCPKCAKYVYGPKYYYATGYPPQTGSLGISNM